MNGQLEINAEIQNQRNDPHPSLQEIHMKRLQEFAGKNVGIEIVNRKNSKEMRMTGKGIRKKKWEKAGLRLAAERQAELFSSTIKLS